MKLIKDNFRYILIIAFVGLLAWFPALNFWFFKGYEATWLTGLTPYNVINLLKGHAFLYFLDYKIFGWNPMGWYATSLILHLIASILLYFFVYLVSKNKILGFLSGLFFVASTAYNDVLTWGSFNSYYPLLLIWMLGSVIAFIKYKDTNKLYFLILSAFFALLGFFTRETGIVIVPLMTLLDLIFSKDLRSKKTIFEILKRQALFYLVLLGFFIVRPLYGGTAGDSADSNVKLQMRFVKDGLYFDYFKAAFLTIGKLIPPQIIPYSILNTIREFFSRFIYFGLINNYLFPFLGWITLAGLGLTYIKIKNWNYNRLFLFFFAWLIVFSAFVALAVPNTSEVLSRAYEYNTMRYRYFAFLGTSVLISLILIKFFTRRFLLISMFIVFINLILIWNIEAKVYGQYYKPAKDFYTKFTTFFPKLSESSVFYLYPNASGLSDYALEWYLTRNDSYKNLKAYNVESQIIAIIDKLKNKAINLSDVVFLDYDKKQGLLNKTEEVRKILSNQKNYSLSFSQKGNVVNAKIENGPTIEFPYDIRMNVALFPKTDFKGKTPDSNKFRVLAAYAKDREDYFNNVVLDTAYTASQRAGEPFYHNLPSFLVDGNIGPRSKWIADTFSPYVTADLGQIKDVAGITWGSLPDSTRVPATYSIFASVDKENWTKVFSAKNSKKAESLDIFSTPVRARYIKMEIYTTSGGDFVLLDEFEVISSDAKGVFGIYKDRDTLFTDTNNIFNFASSKDDFDFAQSLGLVKSRAKMAWETDKTTSSENAQYWYFPVKLTQGSQDITFPLIEGEIYAGEGQFLKKHATLISLDFTALPYIIKINSSELVPREKLK